MRRPMTDQEIRQLLVRLPPGSFLRAPPAHKAILRARVVGAGADPSEVLEWVREQGGDELIAPARPSAGLRRGERLPSPASRERYYVVPRSALAEPGAP